jgi:hypothetical protein
MNKWIKKKKELALEGDHLVPARNFLGDLYTHCNLKTYFFHIAMYVHQYENMQANIYP